MPSRPPPAARRTFGLNAVLPHKMTVGFTVVLLVGQSLAAQEAASRPDVELIERIVAVVDEAPLLLSDVSALGKVRDLDSDAALRAAIDERLMYEEASRMTEGDVSPEEVSVALATLLAKNPRLHGAVPEPDLRRLLRRQLTILHYVELRFRPQVQVSDDDVRGAWERDEAAQRAGVTLEGVFELIRARLERQLLDERIEAWVSELRARAEVRYVEGPLPAGS